MGFPHNISSFVGGNGVPGVPSYSIQGIPLDPYGRPLQAQQNLGTYNDGQGNSVDVSQGDQPSQQPSRNPLSSLVQAFQQGQQGGNSGGGSALGNLLSQFQQVPKSLHDDNTFVNVGNAIANTPIQRSASNRDNFYATIIKSLAGGLATGYGENQAKDEAYGTPNDQGIRSGGTLDLLKRAFEANPQDRNSILAENPDIASEYSPLFQQYDLQSAFNNVLAKGSQQAEKNKVLSNIQADVIKQQALQPGELDKYKQEKSVDFGHQSDLKNLEGLQKQGSDNEAFGAKLRAEISSSPEYKNYSTILPTIKDLAVLKDINSKVSDVPFLYQFVKALHPNAAVRSGEIKLSQEANPALVTLTNKINSEVRGKSGLTVATKNALYDAVKNKTEDIRQQYNDTALPRLRLGLSKGIDRTQMEILPLYQDMPLPDGSTARVALE